MAEQGTITDTFIVEVTIEVDRVAVPDEAINNVIECLETPHQLPPDMHVRAFGGWRIFSAPKES